MLCKLEGVWGGHAGEAAPEPEVARGAFQPECVPVAAVTRGACVPACVAEEPVPEARDIDQSALQAARATMTPAPSAPPHTHTLHSMDTWHDGHSPE